MAWYKTGTVSVTNASTTVTGSGTNFVSGAQVGEAFYGPDDDLYEITAISSATSLTITPAYGGSTASGQSYAIVPTQSLVADLASDVADLISDYQTVVDEAGAGKFGDGSAASPSIKFTQDQDTGFFRDTANEIAISAGGSKIGSFSANGLEFLDNEKATFGTGSDLQIYHDGSNSYIKDGGTGNLKILGTSMNIQSAAGENYIEAVNNAHVKLFYDAAEKLATTSTGIDVTGNATFADNGKAIFGAGNDLQIFSDGTKSYLIENGTGDLEVRATDFVVKNAGNTKIMASFNDGGTVQLRYDNDTKLATTSAGIDVTGEITADGLTVDGDAKISSFSPKLVLEDTDGTAQDDARLQVGASILNIKRDSDNLSRLTVGLSTGDISFYEDTGTTAKFFWDASAESLGIGTSSPLYELHVEDATGNAVVNIESSTSGYSAVNLGDTNNDDVGQIKYDNSTNSMQFTTNASEAMRIDSSGNLLISGTNTTPNVNSAGTTADNEMALRNDGLALFSAYKSTANDGVVMDINRTSTDGGILGFRKDGSAVGSIGTGSTANFQIYNAQSSHVGLEFGSPNIMPTNNSGVLTDAGAALGSSSYRFSDLYLSGGVKSSGGDNVFNDDGGDNDFRVESNGNEYMLKVDGGKNQVYIGSESQIVATNTAFNITSTSTGRAADLYRPSSTTTQNLVNFYSDVGGTTTHNAAIDCDGDMENTNNRYTGFSDQRFKQDIVDATSQWDDIKALQVRKYRFINLVEQLGDDAPVHLGVIAQELEASGMGGLVKTKPMDEDNPDAGDRKSVAYSVLYMKAVKALQEAMERIETLETEMTSVKARLDALEA